MENKKNYIIFFVALVMIAVVASIFALQSKKDVAPVNTVTKSSSADIPISNASNTSNLSNKNTARNVPEVPEIPEVVVPPPPDPYEKLKNLPISIPDKEEPRGTGSKELFKYFTIRFSDSGFNPENIVIGENEVVQVTFKPSAKIFIDSPLLHFNFLSVPGEDMVVVFGPLKKGAYPITCKNMCPASGPITGYIVVK
jgi:heme/copper-type cytochrome/quinol oxidase subunit 2